MKPEDTLKLLAVGISLDARLKGGSGDDPDEMRLKAATWSKVLDADMPLAFAVEAMRAHYAATDQMIMPTHINSRWRNQRRYKFGDSHCGHQGCPCTHADGCYKGWLDDWETGDTAPCPTCRPVVAERLKERSGSWGA